MRSAYAVHLQCICSRLVERARAQPVRIVRLERGQYALPHTRWPRVRLTTAPVSVIPLDAREAKASHLPLRWRGPEPKAPPTV